MLSKKSRLPGDEIDNGFQKIFTSAHFLLKSKPNATNNNRFAIIISNKVIQKSNRRHFFKRFFMNHVAGWPNVGMDFIIIASPHLQNATQEELSSSIVAALGAIKKNDATVRPLSV